MNDGALLRAIEALQNGELVIVPTETVYGLAGCATRTDALERIFRAKSRPTHNPLIVHVADLTMARSLVRDWPDVATRLAEAFWPGPMTLVFEKNEVVPSLATAGATSIALRIPNHPLFIALIRECGPLAAPSANRYTKLSATQAPDLDPDLVRAAAVVLDGGPARYGIESTVVDVRTDPPNLLRPGAIDAASIEAVIGMRLQRLGGETVASPGTHRQHYQPRHRLVLQDLLGPDDLGLTFGDPQSAFQIRMPNDSEAYGSALYAALHQCDRWAEEFGRERISVECPPTDDPRWEAVWDRLKRAAASDSP